MSRQTGLIFSLALALLTPDVAFATGAADDGGDLVEHQRRWRFQVWAGFLPGNPGSGLEETLRGEGFGDTDPGVGWCSLLGCPEARSYPYTDKTYFPWGLELGYRLRPRLTLSAIAANTEIGTTAGYRAEGASIRFTREVRTYGALASWTPTDRFRIGAGPALYKLRLDPSSADGQARATHLGALADATVDIFRGRRFTLSAKAQYRYAGSITAGPFTTYSYSWFSERSESTLGPIDVSYNHFFIAASVGVRF